MRINHSLELIKKDYPLSIIAVECGFFDQSHFIKEFKKMYGITPLKFTKNMKLTKQNNYKSNDTINTNLSQNTEQTL